MSIWSRLPKERLLADYSLWSADLAALGESIRATEPYADLYHIDVADGHFVPGLLFFPELVAALRGHTETPLHVHLMTEHPAALAPAFLDAGADLLTVHADNSEAPEAIDLVRSRGRSAGVAVELETDPGIVKEFAESISLVLMMGTPLGVKGVEMDDRAVDRVRVAKDILAVRRLGSTVKVSADGGIREHTVPLLRAAGADVVTPGSLVFKSRDLAATTEWLHGLPVEE
ncbi:MAG: ribulose-phosphate 3-epimerase [Spirochaetes bacterium]|jgi:ribulose-phosphate 3-epimerase|nr:ribulose-phosphate 3-epimerase [Spirochaetota bacterium]